MGNVKKDTIDIVNNHSQSIDIKRLSLEQVSLEIYYFLIDKYDLNKTWNLIINKIKSKKITDLKDTIFDFDSLGELYEIGLAYCNKIEKKEMGKYYTPRDVSSVMSELLLENNNITDLVDVGCGTGNLIIEVINQIREINLFNIIDFIKDGHLWLYDVDLIALKICKVKIDILLEDNVSNYINVVRGDFLSRRKKLPLNCSVITNPPYSIIKDLKSTWNKGPILKQSKDLYAGFIDKITDYCKNAVIVSPQSYLVSDKFTLLRNKIGNSFYGEIFAFDNVPGTLFNGKKHGIFNTNNANGVRAAITSLKRNGKKGFQLTHLIRFRSHQREEVINLEFLRSKLGSKNQDLSQPIKSFKELEPFVDSIINDDYVLFEDIIQVDEQDVNQDMKINVSSSARYYIVATQRELDRSGQYKIYVRDPGLFNLIYLLLNSSYVYMWWRFYDGGILFTLSNLLKVPIPSTLLNRNLNLENITRTLIESEQKYLVYKKNAGKKQESVKFPSEYRREINRILFPGYYEYFELLHKNHEVSDE